MAISATPARRTAGAPYQITAVDAQASRIAAPTSSRTAHADGRRSESQSLRRDGQDEERDPCRRDQKDRRGSPHATAEHASTAAASSINQVEALDWRRMTAAFTSRRPTAPLSASPAVGVRYPSRIAIAASDGRNRPGVHPHQKPSATARSRPINLENTPKTSSGPWSMHRRPDGHAPPTSHSPARTAVSRPAFVTVRSAAGATSANVHRSAAKPRGASLPAFCARDCDRQPRPRKQRFDRPARLLTDKVTPSYQPTRRLTRMTCRHGRSYRRLGWACVSRLRPGQ